MKPQAFTKDYAVYILDNRVYFEHNEYGDDDHICVYHDSQKRVHDYDGSYCMIPQAEEWLNANGYDTSDILG